MQTSLIYRNIILYRLAMNVLYRGQYSRRFEDIISLLQEEDKTILELCFGDVVIAEFCRRHKKEWIGQDINPVSIRLAQKKGFNAEKRDLFKTEVLPACDVCIMSGSLYHFRDILEPLIQNMLSAAKKVIISEPVDNLSSQAGVVGALARRCATIGGGSFDFRFSKEAFLETLDQLKRKFSFTYEIAGYRNRDLIVVLKNESN